MTVDEIIRRCRAAKLTLAISTTTGLLTFKHAKGVKVPHDILQAFKGKRAQVAAALGLQERHSCESPHCDFLNRIAPCPRRCPGALDPNCAGGPDPVEELLYGSGTIAPRWCVTDMDAAAGWTRNRGETVWRKIPGRERIQEEFGAELERQGLVFAEAGNA